MASDEESVDPAPKPKKAKKKGGKGKLIVALVVVLALAGGGVFGAAKMGFLQIAGISPPKGKGPAPTDLKAVPGDAQVILTWVPAKGAATYVVKRGEKAEGPFEVVQKDIKETTFTDTKLKNGKEVFYTVAAIHPKGASLDLPAVPAKPVAPPTQPAPEPKAAPTPKKPAAPTTDPAQGAERLADLWNQMEAGELARMTAKWTERDLARVMNAMAGEQAAALLSEIARQGDAGPERASRLSREIERLGAQIETPAKG